MTFRLSIASNLCSSPRGRVGPTPYDRGSVTKLARNVSGDGYTQNKGVSRKRQGSDELRVVPKAKSRLARCLIAGLAAVATGAAANPQGAQVVSGTATFSQPSANVLNVTNSHNAIINWQSFSIGQGQTTNFIQPSSASAVLNRVMGNNPSRIYGNLNSNGKVFLINQHGLMIGAGAQINTAGFFGSTLNITNEDFLNGRLNFAGGGFGGIENHGYIHAGPGGNVVLIAPDIENGGVIEVEDGNVILAAGESIRITSLNDASIEFDVQAPDNGIINLGSIVAEHGAARLFAGNLEHSGDINASGIVQNADGSISLVASHDIEIAAGSTLVADGQSGGDITVRSHHGTVLVAGEVAARGAAGEGGDIRILGEQVGVVGSARIDASGSAAGGQILVGGDYLGGNPDVQNARATYVGPATSLHADATEHGNGGRVIVWSDEATRSYGAISARGGPQGGDGGFIETSGSSLDLGNSVPDVSAPAGRGGEWLIDPNNIRIQAAGPDTNISAGPNFTTLSDAAILTTLAIDTALDGGAVTISTGTAAPNTEVGNIDIIDDITYNNTAANTLTLNAHNDINLMANISSIGGGSLNVLFNADSDASGAGRINLNGGADLFGSFDFGSGVDATFFGGTYRNLTWSNSAAMPVTLAANNNVTFDNVTLDTDLIALDGSKINIANNLNIGSVRTLTLASNGAITSLESISAAAAINGPGSLVLGGTTVNNQILVGANSTLTLGTGLNVSGQGAMNALNATSSLVNNGTIMTDGLGLTIDALNWSNAGGDLIASNNATLTLRQAARFNDGNLQVDAGATISTENVNLFNVGSGVVKGNGLITVGTGTFVNDATVEPGVGVDSPGVINVLGNYSQGSTGTLNIELDGTDPGNGPGYHDQLAISGIATLDGTLNVSYVSGYTPNAFDSFSVVTFASQTGGFVNTNQPVGFDPLAVSLNSIDLFFNPGGVYFWTGAGDGFSWDDATNWSIGVPGIANDVNIGAFNITAVSGGNANSLTIAVGGSLDITGGTMTTNGLLLSGDLSIAAGAALAVQNGTPDEITVTLTGQLINNGGTLTNQGSSLFDGAFVQNLASASSTFAGAANFKGPFTLTDGTLLLNGGGTLTNRNNSWTGGTIGGTGSLVMTGVAGTTSLALSGPATKTLDGFTFDTNANDVDVFGNGSLDLINGAVVVNQGGGESFHHFGNGDIISSDGSGLFDNSSSRFVNFGGDTTVSVDFTNNALVQALGGVLRFSGDFQNFDRVEVAGGIVEVADVEGNDLGAYTVASNGALVFSANRSLNGSLAQAGILQANNSTLVLPAALTNSGIIDLVNATLDLSALPGATLTLDSSLLGGTGTITGNVVNNSGALVVGGIGNIGNLTISGSYTQNANAATVVEVFNNGFNTVSDRLTVNGLTTLNGGSLVVGFTTTSLGLVTGNFVPFIFNGGVTGSFSDVFDAGGNLLFLDVNGPVFTVLGASPEIPEEILSDLLDFIQNRKRLEEEIANAESAADATIDEIEQTLVDEDGDSLICI